VVCDKGRRFSFSRLSGRAGERDAKASSDAGVAVRPNLAGSQGSVSPRRANEGGHKGEGGGGGSCPESKAQEAIGGGGRVLLI